ncbi:reverse transcriptase domain-containing protein [Tanacetum coccineum]
MFKQLYINITLADALILIPKYQKMLKALFSNKEKLLELANIPLNENCSAVILKKLPEKLGDPEKFLILCGFSELKCKALADLGASINLMPLSVWKKLGLLELISIQMTLELANRSVCTPVGIERDVFIPVGRPFLRTDRALIDVHGEELILRDGEERLILNMKHDTSSYSNKPQRESINMIDIYNISYEDYLEDLIKNKKITNHLSGNPTFSSEHNTFTSDLTSPEVKDDIFDPEGDIVLIEKLLNLDSTKDLPPSHNINPLSGNTTSSSPSLTTFEISDYSLEEFVDELALIESFSSGNDDMTPEDENKIKDSKLLIDELDSPGSSSFRPHFLEGDSVFYEDFFEVDTLTSTDNEDKVFNPGILVHENLYEVTNRVTPDKNVKKISSSNASLILEDFNPPLSDHELPFHIEIPGSETLLSFSSENEEKVFNPGILISKGVYSLLPELSHRDSKAFKVINIFEIPMEIFPCSYREDIRVLDVPCIRYSLKDKNKAKTDKTENGIGKKQVLLFVHVIGCAENGASFGFTSFWFHHQKMVLLLDLQAFVSSSPMPYPSALMHELCKGNQANPPPGQELYKLLPMRDKQIVCILQNVQILNLYLVYLAKHAKHEMQFCATAARHLASSMMYISDMRIMQDLVVEMINLVFRPKKVRMEGDLEMIMEHGHLSSKGRCKTKKDRNDSDDCGNVIKSGNVGNMGTYVAATKVDQNVVGDSIASVSSLSQDTTGPSNIHTSIPMVENTRPVSYTSVVPMEPTTVPSSANDVTKGPDLSENTKGPVSFAELATSEPSRKIFNFCTFVWPTSNKAISKDGMNVMLENGHWLIRNTLLILKELTPDVNLLKEDVGNVLVCEFHNVPITAFNEDGFSTIATILGTPWMFDSYTSAMCKEPWGRCTIHVEYEQNPPRSSTSKVFGHVLDICPKRIISNVLKNLKTPRQVVRGVQVSLKVGFKPTKQVYQHVDKKNGANISGKKKQDGFPRQEVSNSNSFDALNLVENDDDLAQMINKLERQILDGKLMLMDDDGKPLKKVDPPVNSDSESEVEEVFNEIAGFMASTRLKSSSKSGYGTKTLLEQWRETKVDDDYDSYDEDLYDGYDMYENLQAICEDLDINVRDRKKK